MKIEDQVVSLENAKRLQELGVRSGESMFYYMVCGGMNYLRPRATTPANPLDTLIPAYTVAELGEMLPWVVEEEGIASIVKSSSGWICKYSFFGIVGKLLSSDSMADATAQMLIWLLENGHITAQEVSQ